jgi:hypothetical protein
MILHITVKAKIDDVLIERLKTLLTSHHISTESYDANAVIQDFISGILSQGDYLLTDPEINSIFKYWLEESSKP